MEANKTLGFMCPLCFGTFQRAEHLRRHTLTHVDDKQHSCHFCGARYKRSDTLRRHWITCERRIELGDQIPKRSSSGKRKHACTRCTSRKRACSTGLPCSECLSQGAECTYSGTETLGKPSKAFSTTPGLSQCSENVNINREDFDRPCSQTQPPTRLLKDVSLPREIEPSKCRFDFLINFTRAKGLNEAYNYRSLTEQSVTDCAASKDVSYDAPPLNCAEASNPFDCYSGEIEASLWKDFELSPYIPIMEPDDTLLNEKAFQISETLQSLIEKTPLHFEALPDLPKFFSSENIKRYLDLFWDRWYRHCPIIHRPTFSLESCSSLLLAVMSLVGACMSSRQNDHDEARQILNLTEELLFSQTIFAELDFSFSERTAYPKTIQNVQMLQAACFMCLLQKWEGDKAAKLRMQRHRFTAIVAATRAMGLSQPTTKRANLGSKVSTEQWKDYMLQEQLNRTFNHVFLLDSAFVIFHNSVPRMVLQEMTIDLTCPEEVFQASTPEEFVIVSSLKPAYPEPPLLTDCVRNLCAENPSSAIIEYLHNETALNLFTTATAIHGLIFHQLRAFSPFPLATAPLKKALDRWELAWVHSRAGLADPNGLRKHSSGLAFFQRAREFALLARVHVEKSHLSVKEWDDLIKNLPEEPLKNSGEYLATFDQTGMDHVAELMLAVDHLDLN